MIYIFLAVFLSLILLVIFKFFPKYGVNTLVAIVFNYFIAGITGIIYLEAPFSSKDISEALWLKTSLPLGALFIVVFYLISLTAQKISISTASIANKMSVVMPVLFSLFYLHEQLTGLKLVGILLAIISLYLSSITNGDKVVSKKLLFLPILVFFGSGLIDVTINYVNAFYLVNKQDSAMFTLSSFLFAFLIGLLLLMFFIVSKKIEFRNVFQLKNMLGALVLGVPNYFSIYFIFKALETGVLRSSQLFPLLNLSNVVLAALLAGLVFKEKLTLVNIMGIILAVISILLIAL